MAENFDRSKPHWPVLPSSETPGAILQTSQSGGCRCCCSHPYSFMGVARAHSVHDHFRGLGNTVPPHIHCNERDSVPIPHYFNVENNIHAQDLRDFGNTIPSYHDHTRETLESHWNYANNEGLCQHVDHALECSNRTGAEMPRCLPTGQHFYVGTEEYHPCRTVLQHEHGRVCGTEHRHVRPLHWPGDYQLQCMHTPLSLQSASNAHDHVAEVSSRKAEAHGNTRNKPSCKCTICSELPYDSFHTDQRQRCLCWNCSTLAFAPCNQNGEELANMKTNDYTELPRAAPIDISDTRRHLTFVPGYPKESRSNQCHLNSKDQTNPSLVLSTDHLQLKAKNVNSVPRSVRAAKQQGIMLHQASSRLMDKPQMQVAQFFPSLDVEEEIKRRLSCSVEPVGNELKIRSTGNSRNLEHVPLDLHICFENTDECGSSVQRSKLVKSQNYQSGINELPFDLKRLREEVDKPQSILGCNREYFTSLKESNQYTQSAPKQDMTRQRLTGVHKRRDSGNADFVTSRNPLDNPSTNKDFNLHLQDDLSGVWYNPESCSSQTDFSIKEPCSPILKSDGKINVIRSEHSTYDTGIVQGVPNRGVDISKELHNVQLDTELNVESCHHRKIHVQCNMKQPGNWQTAAHHKGYLAEDCTSELTILPACRLQSNTRDSSEIERPPPPYIEHGQRNDMLASQQNGNCYQTEENDSLATVSNSTIKNCFDIDTKDCDFPGKEDCLIDFSDNTEPGSELLDDQNSSKPEVKQKMYRKEKRIRYYPAFFKLYMEQHVENVMKSYYKRLQRRHQLEEEMEALHLSEKEKDHCRSFLFRKESMYNRLKRTRMNRSLFETVAILGRGAFGDVSLVRRRDSGVLYAMKTLRKKDVLRRKQIAHVKAERDLLAEADSNWVVKLYYSFQDSQCLYFVMEYIAGGDLMGLLMKLKIFDHAMAQFYTAELVLAIESVHQLGYIHRDIKPDNILVGLNGHIKLTDFGLCTGFHWTHDSQSYAAMDPDDGCLQGNQQSQRNLAKSLVGTPNYIAPEVLLQTGYTSCCDWWSVGVIVFEMLVGHPPFMSDTAIDTQLKVIHWRSTLDIPKSANLSCDAVDVIHRLCCDQTERLGRAGADEVKGHPFLNGIDFETLHLQTAPYIPHITHPLDTSNFDAVEPIRPGQSDAMEPNVFCDLIYDSTKHAFLDFTFRRFFDGTSEQ